MEAGMDSLSAVEFRNRIAGQLPDVKLPNTLIFDYPTIDAVATFILRQVGPALAPAGPAQAVTDNATGEFRWCMHGFL